MRSICLFRKTFGKRRGRSFGCKSIGQTSNIRLGMGMRSICFGSKAFGKSLSRSFGCKRIGQTSYFRLSMGMRDICFSSKPTIQIASRSLSCDVRNNARELRCKSSRVVYIHICGGGFNHHLINNTLNFRFQNCCFSCHICFLL